MLSFSLFFLAFGHYGLDFLDVNHDSFVSLALLSCGPKSCKIVFYFLLTATDFFAQTYNLLEVDDFLSDSEYLWTFDDVHNIKDEQGQIWAQSNRGALNQTAGVRRRAVQASGGAGHIRIGVDQADVFTQPVNEEGTISLWIKYQSKGPGIAQTFLSVGREDEKGIHLYQGNGSREELTLLLRASFRSCSFTFGVPQRVWTHLVYSKSGWPNEFKIYRNGNLLTEAAVVKNCQDRNLSQGDKNIILGSSQLPTAKFDDFVVWKKTLTDLQVEKLFKFYKGNSFHTLEFNYTTLKGNKFSI